MKVAIFSAKNYERAILDEVNAAYGHELVYFDVQLGPATVSLAVGFPAVSVFVNDVVNADVLRRLADAGTRLVATRSTGFNQMDLQAAAANGVRVGRVADYSPNSVAEFAVGLLLALNRKIPRAYNRTRDGNFELDGLMGFDFVGRTVAVIGTGKIGTIFGRIMAGFGCTVIGFDVYRSPEFERIGGRYVDLAEVQAEADVISLHCPLTPQTHHIIDGGTLGRLKRGALLINTSRGGLVDAEAAIEALKSGQLGGMAIDVYEEEAGLFFKDLSNTVIADDVIERLVSFSNVIVTGHQAFFTREALRTILDTTLASIADFAAGRPLANEIKGTMDPVSHSLVAPTETFGISSHGARPLPP
jgi:D-lactate dehydrogenase